MTRKLINILILLPIGIVLVLLSVANRGAVTMALNPFRPDDTVLSVSAPFFVYIFIAFILGAVLGSLFTWVAQRKHRRNARHSTREAALWREEADKHKSRAEQIAGARPLDQLPSA
ncbi:LapA family protein [Martelella endophytica]|uniref:Membrane protein n=1 Tax=Martelella endophytica TaxID=1486262 RepID=A0A0D5LTT2_MAREN|nr:LapA family protein [Martelella endophytica]AJY47365.1 membrane protein [Martelella endophytica]